LPAGRYFQILDICPIRLAISGYDPKKIVTEFSNIKSLKRREKILEDDCQMFENRMSEYRQVLPLLQQIRALGIDIDKLIAFNIAVNEKAQTNNLSVSAAA
jgi:hypothetical protein